MNNNIIERYINNVQRRLRKYNSMILKSKYDKGISDELIQTYIDARYYNYGTNEKIRFFYRRIYDALLRKGQQLVKKEPRKKELIDNTIAIFQYYFYFDFVRGTNDLDKIVDSICEKRIFKLNIKSAVDDKNFKEELLELVREDIKEVKELLVSYGSKDFSLEFKKYSSDENYLKVRLNYFMEFPEIFSKEAIEEVFNTDIIAEDRLFVEYPMVSIEALKDILGGNFNKIYICDFASSLLNKKSKANQILQVIENQAIQDKMYLKVSYEDFLKSKEKIYDLIRRGFKFALETNSQMEKLANDEIKVLEVFSCIIVDNYDINKNKYKNVKILQE